MTRFRIKYLALGAHITCTLFASREDRDAFEMLGAFTCRPDEFDDLQQELSSTNVQFVDRAVSEA